MVARLAPTRITVDRKGPAPDDDAARIEACLRGDQAAWDQVVDRYGRLVYSITRRYGLDDADADDVFQNVFIILFRRLESLRDRTRLSAWLITTTHRECWRIGRRGGRAEHLDALIADVGAPDPDQAQAWEEQHLVRIAIDRLGGRCADLLRALFLEPAAPDYQAIADRLGMKVGSIGPTRARCFRKLEAILVEMGIEAPDALEAVGVEGSR